MPYLPEFELRTYRFQIVKKIFHQRNKVIDGGFVQHSVYVRQETSGFERFISKRRVFNKSSPFGCKA